MKELNNYWELFKGNEGLMSEMGYAKPAVEVLVYDGRLVAQQRLWDEDETIIPLLTIIRKEPLRVV